MPDERLSPEGRARQDAPDIIRERRAYSFADATPYRTFAAGVVRAKCLWCDRIMLGAHWSVVRELLAAHYLGKHAAQLVGGREGAAIDATARTMLGEVWDLETPVGAPVPRPSRWWPFVRGAFYSGSAYTAAALIVLGVWVAILVALRASVTP